MTLGRDAMTPLTILSVSETIYHNLLTSMVQDIVSRTTSRQQLQDARYPGLAPLHHDQRGALDVYGRPKPQEASVYFRCPNCSRDLSANRFAAHLERCMSRGARRG
ncbi:AGL255Wp [Eremothecium gossypii ATCC 10895]|uniref:SAGA-associated factor 11 n=1 Tax=Eremothecium gossypii (strain ATCC 10895 / CBS 109.51 / FGSC 9923 / NRRL Y-1056) TaxID=284811 RepID=SGF11_EREGS|nr:AGL255Wp [Eremothecium gossypii ATCC 10895]Q751G1.1 RecName: Full=SAGA-associated factor 11 [Eremothecium gossypii ATCC 10895]AAS54236.1 AGL255Wp [Eremothecium gossypii ATCC 10895]AEY98562.1 FAGL255Wp [Eremothecium gossypii FDAG1]